MTYVEIPVTSSTSPPIGELWAAQPIDTPANSAILFAQPSQDIWRLNLSTGVAAEIRNGFGPQTASMRWDGNSDGEKIWAAFPKTPNRRSLRGGGRQLQGVNLDGSDHRRIGFSGGATEDVVESRAMAGIIGGDAYLWTAANLYRIARDTTQADLQLTLIGDHGLGDVTAAAYWPSAQRFIVCANDRLLFFDPTDRSTEPVLSATLPSTRGLFVAGGQLYAVGETSIARFDSATLVAPSAQQIIEQDRWEIRLRARKGHEILALLTPNEIVDAEFNWRMTTMASGRLQVAATVLDPDLLNEMAYPSEAMGGVDVEFYREHRLGTDQFLGVVSTMNFLRGPTDNISSLNVGNIVNSIWVLGDRLTGTGGAECRTIAEVGDDFLIAARGIHQGVPLDARGATTRGELEAVGRAEMERQLRRLKVDDDVDFERSQRIDRISIYLDDPFVYFDRRYSNPGTEEARAYGGATAGDYVAAMVQAELQTPPFNLANERDLRLDAQMTWRRASVGNSFNVPYPRTRLLNILEQAALAGGLVLRYKIDPQTNELMMTTQTIRDRTVGADRIVLVDGGEAVDPDSVLPGDRVERELVVGERVIGGTARSQLRSTVGGCSEGAAAELLSSSFGDAGVLVLQRQILIDGQRGLQAKLSTGDITQSRLDVERAVIDLSNTARVS